MPLNVAASNSLRAGHINDRCDIVEEREEGVSSIEVPPKFNFRRGDRSEESGVSGAEKDEYFVN